MFCAGLNDHVKAEIYQRSLMLTIYFFLSVKMFWLKVIIEIILPINKKQMFEM